MAAGDQRRDAVPGARRPCFGEVAFQQRVNTVKVLRELNATELAEIEGGLWMQLLDNWISAMTGGLCGYGPNGFEGPYQTVYKNPKGGNP